jgi:hypothetical protein
MPTFPNYPGKLPKCLNPFDWRHYFLVAYWVFFRPTAFKCYLYQADPELYRGDSGKGIGAALALPAYRNLIVVALGLMALIASMMIVSSMLLASHSLRPQMQMMDWASVFAIIYFGGIAIGVIYGTALGVLNGVCLGLSSGVAAGLAFGVASGIALPVLAGFGSGLGYKLAAGIAAGLNQGIVSVFSLGMVSGGGLLLGLAFGLAFGLIFGLAEVVGLFMSGGVAGFEMGWITTAVVAVVAYLIGFLRLPIYILQGGGLLRAPWRGFHPIWWDELALLPFLKSEVAIANAWRSGDEVGLQRLAQFAANPYQHWVVQRALIRRLHESAAPIHFLYRLFHIKELDAYAIAPLAKIDWPKIPTVLQIYLGELADIANADATIYDKWVWSLTQPLRSKNYSPLTGLSRLLLLYHMARRISSRLDAEYGTIPEDNLQLNDLLKRLKRIEQNLELRMEQCIDLDQFLPLFPLLLTYPGGEELQRSFSCMASCLRATSLAELANGESWFEGMPAAEAAIRPPVIEALGRFAGIRQDIAVSEVASSRVNQLSALGRAIEGLEELRVFITREVWSPEQVLLQMILQRWRSLVSEASGRLGKQVVSKPVANPYVAGNPVTGQLFVGRDDILRELEELWLSRGQVDSVVLFGHRRMGKSSILKNLPARLDPTYNRVVQFNLQQIGRVRHTGELLHALALEMRDHLPANGPPSPAVPEQETFEANPNRAFSGWLKAIAPLMTQRRFIVAIDEYELLEAAMAEGRIDASLTTYLRSVIQSTDWFVLVLAGLYTLEEKCHDYWHPLFASIKPRKVSFLSPAATRLLLCQPSEDFSLNYTADTIEEVVRLSNGQPYLVQLIGQNLVTRFNRQVFELGQDPERPISLDDLLAVIDSPDFFQDGTPYFKGIWMQAADAPFGQQAILKALSQESKDLQQLVAETGLSEDAAKEALGTLTAHDVVLRLQDAQRYGFTVELMRRWVLHNSEQPH